MTVRLGVLVFGFGCIIYHIIQIIKAFDEKQIGMPQIMDVKMIKLQSKLHLATRCLAANLEQPLVLWQASIMN